ncbi:MAG: Gfo/Idh/MocA family oxidoreductase [Clostridia bacterium]|nr:Gfo/Idh/MocA family oxidoreductase [Clostridia bacterium]
MKVAIVGCGNVSALHFDAAFKSPLAELTAAVDIKPERALKYAAKYGINAYTDYYEMLDAEKPDVVHICTPHYLHTTYAVEALKRGINVLSEKPCSVNDEEVRILREAQKNSSAQYAVCFQNRYNSCIKRLIKVRDSGELGSIKAIRAFVTWRRDKEYYSDDWHGTREKECGCLLINQAIHTLDLIGCIGGDCKALSAHVSNDGLREIIECEDTASIRMELENGVTAVFYGTLAYGSNSPVLIEVVFENGILRTEGEKLFKIEDDGSINEISLKAKEAGGRDYWGSGHPSLIGDFYDAISTGRKFTTDAFSGGKAAKIVFAAYRSSELGARIEIDNTEE